jgi:acetyltransferase-like isoleucine patch superfamily enzyme
MNNRIESEESMTPTGNTEAETKLKTLLGARGAAQLRQAVKVCLRLVSYAPFQFLRLLGLKLAGATIGKDVVLSSNVEVLSPWRLTVGSHTNIGRDVHLDSRGDLTIGDNVNISDEVAIWTAEHDIQAPNFPMTRDAVIIENRVWVCFRSTILPGVRLGEGCVVASGAVVTKNVPPFSVVAGVPAKVVGSRNKALTYQLGRSAN